MRPIFTLRTNKRAEEIVLNLFEGIGEVMWPGIIMRPRPRKRGNVGR